MKSIRVHDTTNLQIDWLITRMKGYKVEAGEDTASILAFKYNHSRGLKHWSTKPALLIPIIDSVGMDILCNRPADPKAKPGSGWDVADWFACMWNQRNVHWHGRTMLIAAARCYVGTAHGEIVQIPWELT